MELVREISFHSKQFSESDNIAFVKVDFNQTDIDNIKKASEFVKENNFVEHVRVNVTSDYAFLNEDSEDITGDWEHEAVKFIVYNDVIYLYAQNDDDSGDQVESECFEIIML